MSKASRRRKKRQRQAVVNKYKATLKSEKEVLDEKSDLENAEPTPIGRKDGKPDKTLDRDRKHWTQEEVDELMKGIATGKTNQDISYNLKRKTDAIKRKRMEVIGQMMKDADKTFNEVNNQPLDKKEIGYRETEPGFFISHDQFFNLYNNWRDISACFEEVKEGGEEIAKMMIKNSLQKYYMKKEISNWAISMVGVLAAEGVDLKCITDLQANVSVAENSVTDKEIEEEFKKYSKEPIKNEN